MKVTLKSGPEEYALTRTSARGSTVPKRGNGVVECVVDGMPATLKVTSNRAWCGSPEKALEYIWLQLPSGAYYVTLGYGEKAANWAGEELTVSEGSGPKPVTRVNGTVDKCETEGFRILKFKAWAARN